jgi:hypothetical protein
MLVKLSYAFLALFCAVAVLLGLVAWRKEAGKQTFDLEKPKSAWRMLWVLGLLLALSSPAVYDTTDMDSAQGSMGMTILFVLIVLGFPAVCIAFYYVSVLGNWFGEAVYGDDSPPPPGAEAAELDRARAAAARHDLPEAIRLTEEQLRIQPDNLEALHYLAVLLFRNGNYDRCAEVTRQALARDAAARATNTGLIEEGRADLLTLLADALERAGRAEEAATVLEKALPSLTVERFRRTLAERAERLRGNAGREHL